MRRLGFPPSLYKYSLLASFVSTTKIKVRKGERERELLPPLQVHPRSQNRGDIERSTSSLNLLVPGSRSCGANLALSNGVLTPQHCSSSSHLSRLL
ncbi:hypothetical protein M6B38_265075 [Iris pallida]|uniref:Uncharacterized protein n=1 Tax=Iris pallida TaxID=29817 RepID=A0AAX6IB04_IRIPA|nr:hypothetical protein M6B38_265075 [Iris pallida]